MLDNLTGEDGRLSCAVIGATGGIGAAFAEAFAASPRVARLSLLARKPPPDADSRWTACDITDEGSVEAAAARTGPLDCLVIASGLLHRDHVRPEKDWRHIDPAAMAEIFAVNAIGPAVAMKHFAPLLPRERPSLVVALSARVGSIADNSTGGWYAYRASKAALNQIIRTFSIELSRKRPQAIVAGLHPGTVETNLSAPFSGGPARRLEPGESVARLLAVMGGLGRADSGFVYDWKGERVPE